MEDLCGELGDADRLQSAAQPLTQIPLSDLLTLVWALATSPKPVPTDQAAGLEPQSRIVATGAVRKLLGWVHRLEAFDCRQC